MTIGERPKRLLSTTETIRRSHTRLRGETQDGMAERSGESAGGRGFPGGAGGGDKLRGAFRTVCLQGREVGQVPFRRRVLRSFLGSGEIPILRERPFGQRALRGGRGRKCFAAEPLLCPGRGLGRCLYGSRFSVLQVLRKISRPQTRSRPLRLRRKAVRPGGCLFGLRPIRCAKNTTTSVHTLFATIIP